MGVAQLRSESRRVSLRLRLRLRHEATCRQTETADRGQPLLRLRLRYVGEGFRVSLNFTLESAD